MRGKSTRASHCSKLAEWLNPRTVFCGTRRKSTPRLTNSAGPGKSAHTAVAHQNLLVEGAPPHCEAAMSLLDLAKAYEHVRHVRIVDGADGVGFSRVILRLLFKMFARLGVSS